MTGNSIHQFFMPFAREQLVLMPKGSRVLLLIEHAMEWQLHVAMPDTDPSEWQWVSHELKCFRPEQYVSDFDSWQYIGAVKEPHGSHWWHAFIRELTPRA